ncbi:MAG: hypothetical protein ACKONH_08865 [Planctomycetia bacterium]
MSRAARGFVRASSFVALLAVAAAARAAEPAADAAPALEVKVVATEADLIGPLDAGPDGQPDVCLQVPIARDRIKTAQVDGEGGDAWQTPFNGRNWNVKLVPAAGDAATRLHFAPSQTRRNYRVTLLLDSGASVSGVAILAPGQTEPVGLPPPATLDLPADVEAAWNALPRDGNGQVMGVRVGKFWLHGSKHVQVARGLVFHREGTGEPIVAERAADFGDYTIREYPHPIGIDDVVTSLPPVGTAVWQVVRPGLYRTSRIARYSGAVAPEGRVVSTLAMLEPAGPHPGVPIGGDSGSVGFVRIGGKVRVLGVVGLARSVFIAVPARWPAEFDRAAAERPVLGFPAGGTPENPYPQDSRSAVDAATAWDPPTRP